MAHHPAHFGAGHDTPDGEFAKTFFNSVYRDVLRSLDIDPTQVSDTADVVSPDPPLRHPARLRNYINWTSACDVVSRLLADFRFDTPYSDLAGDAAFVCAELAKLTASEGDPDDAAAHRGDAGHLLPDQPRFRRRQAVLGATQHTLRTGVRNGSDGIRGSRVEFADDVSVLFGFSRSYFMVDVEPVEGAVEFIKSMLPRKPLDELFTILGRARQGKTERARSFYRHLADCEDHFVHAPGDRGLVMLVFTLPSYDLVFKVIRDNFGHPKNVSHDEVKRKYKFVFNHDRAGRLIDTQEFRNIEFPLAKFAPELLEELLGSASQTVRIDGEQLVIDHLYSERRLTPLNLFLQDYEFEPTRLALLDYGQAIKDLALTNIFPGDLLLKNFGVSRHGRVIFTTTTNCAWSPTATSATRRKPPITTTNCARRVGSTSARTTSFRPSSCASWPSTRNCATFSPRTVNCSPPPGGATSRPCTSPTARRKSPPTTGSPHAATRRGVSPPGWLLNEV